MTISHGYCTLSELQQWLTPPGQTFSSDPADNSVLETIIEASSRFIDGECCRYFYKNSADETRYFTAMENAVEVGDLVSITTLTTDEGLRTYPTTWATTDYDLYPYNAVLDGKPYGKLTIAVNGMQVFPNALPKGVKIVGVFGWPSVPTAIKEACLLISLGVYKRRFGENISSIATMTTGGVMITPQDVPSVAWSKLNPFRRRR